MFAKRLNGLVSESERNELIAVFDAYPEELKQDEQSLKRKGIYNPDLGVRIAVRSIPLVRELVGYRIRFMYCFVGCYYAGGCLPIHLDKGHSKFSVSLLLGSTGSLPPEAWPLLFQIGPTVGSVALSPGDAVLYSGAITPHWRDLMPKGLETYTHMLMHYLPDVKTGIHPI